MIGVVWLAGALHPAAEPKRDKLGWLRERLKVEMGLTDADFVGQPSVAESAYSYGTPPQTGENRVGQD